MVKLGTERSNIGFTLTGQNFSLISSLAGINPYKPNLLFVGHRQIVQTQIRRRSTRHLIRVSGVYLQNVILRFKQKHKYHPTPLKLETNSSF